MGRRQWRRRFLHRFPMWKLVDEPSRAELQTASVEKGHGPIMFCCSCDDPDMIVSASMTRDCTKALATLTYSDMPAVTQTFSVEESLLPYNVESLCTQVLDWVEHYMWLPSCVLQDLDIPFVPLVEDGPPPAALVEETRILAAPYWPDPRDLKVIAQSFLKNGDFVVIWMEAWGKRGRERRAYAYVSLGEMQIVHVISSDRRYDCIDDLYTKVRTWLVSLYTSHVYGPCVKEEAEEDSHGSVTYSTGDDENELCID